MDPKLTYLLAQERLNRLRREADDERVTRLNEHRSRGEPDADARERLDPIVTFAAWAIARGDRKPV
jgi:hypothetical protein